MQRKQITKDTDGIDEADNKTKQNLSRLKQS